MIGCSRSTKVTNPTLLGLTCLGFEQAEKNRKRLNRFLDGIRPEARFSLGRFDRKRAHTRRRLDRHFEWALGLIEEPQSIVIGSRVQGFELLDCQRWTHCANQLDYFVDITHG